jgi:hypothetical protein
MNKVIEATEKLIEIFLEHDENSTCCSYSQCFTCRHFSNRLDEAAEKLR